MAKKAELPWDCLLPGEAFRTHRLHPATFLGVAQVFDVEPDALLMVSAHHEDPARA